MSGTGLDIRRAPGAAPDSRFEYRIWPRRPHPAVALLQGAWPLVGAERRADIYLLNDRSGQALAKLRDGRRLEIKLRAEDVGPLQRWTVALSQPFPLRRGDLALLAEALGLDPPPPEAALSPAHLLAAIAGAVTPRTVRKARLRFERDGCRAEICRVAAGRRAALTIALESRDPSAVVAAIAALRLGGAPNRSYGDALPRLVGPEPGRGDHANERRET